MNVYVLLGEDGMIATRTLYFAKDLAISVAKEIAQPNDRIRYIPHDSKLVIDHQATESRGYTIWRTEGEEIIQDRNDESEYSETWTIRQYPIEGYNHMEMNYKRLYSIYLLDRITEEADRLRE